MLFGSKELIGVDLGSRYIKVAEASLSSGSIKVNKVSVIETPEGAYSAGELVNPQILAGALSYYFKQLKLKTKKVAVAVQGASVIVKKISMLKVDRKVLDQQIRWEAEQYIPFDLNQVSLAYHVLGSDTGSDAISILLAASQNSVINNYKEVLKLAQLDVQVIDISAFALFNTAEIVLAKSGLFKNILLLHIGAHVTHLVVVIRGTLDFIRDIAFGSHFCTLEIKKELGISLEEAETLKVGLSAGEGVPEEVIRVVEQFNQQLAEEIKNSIDYYLSTAPEDTRFDSIVLSGGGAKGFGLKEKLEEVTQLSCHPLDMTTSLKLGGNIPLSVADISQICPISIGLALRKKGDHE